jgi:phosphohistidine phosphatase
VAARQLLLLRHAEAAAVPPGSPAAPGSRDFDRPLTPRGHSQAQRAARLLQQAGLQPDLIMASPAVRARDTAAIVAAQLGYPREVDQQPALYQAGAPALLSALQRCEAGAQTVLLVAHNPGLSELAQGLAGAQRLAGAHAARRDGPDQRLTLATGALCRLELDTRPWSALQPDAVTAMQLLADGGRYCTVQKQ